jgi:hypothetical protein
VLQALLGALLSAQLIKWKWKMEMDILPFNSSPQQILPEFFKHFWVRRMALDRRNYRALVETTVEIAGKVRWNFAPHCVAVAAGLG